MYALVTLRRSDRLHQQVGNVEEGIGGLEQGIIDLRMELSSKDDVESIHRRFDELATLMRQSAESKPATIENPDNVNLTQVNQRRFDRALAELKSGSVATAERELRDLLEDFQQSTVSSDSQLVFRTTANLGTALFYLGRTKEAADYFDQAYRLNSESVRAKANKALAYLIRKDYSGATECEQRSSRRTSDRYRPDSPYEPGFE